MIMKLNQKGQDIVEFAIIMPLLLFFVLLIMFFGFVFSDYLALNSLARTISRDISLYESNNTSAYRTYIVNKGYSTSDLPNSYYVWHPNNSGFNYLSFQNNDISTGTGSATETDSVKVTLTAKVADNDGLYNTFIRFFDAQSLRTLKVEYTMRKENGRK